MTHKKGTPPPPLRVCVCVWQIESRLLSQEWLEMDPKPVERRYLWSPASLAPQGKLEVWVEILTPPQALASKPKVLRAPSALDCELRVVVWKVCIHTRCSRPRPNWPPMSPR